MNKKTIYWHIGLPKTGTTTLQKNLFPYLDKINYLGLFYSKNTVLNSINRKNFREFIFKLE